MGTRHLIAVQLDGDLKIAQYGQWDGYPAGQGATVLDFLRNKMSPRLFRKALRASRFLTPTELAVLDGTDWTNTHPQLSRDVGATILEKVQDSNGLTLKDSRDFAADSLFCEWAYVIDLDKRRLEVYKGFNTSVEKPKGRFGKLPAPTKGEYEGASQYYPVELIKTYPLNKLPTEKRFLRDLEPEPDEGDEA